MVCFCHAVTLLRILECVGYMSISSDDLKHILRLLKVEEDEPVVRSCVVSGYKWLWFFCVRLGKKPKIHKAGQVVSVMRYDSELVKALSELMLWLQYESRWKISYAFMHWCLIITKKCCFMSRCWKTSADWLTYIILVLYFLGHTPFESTAVYTPRTSWTVLSICHAELSAG